MIPEEKCNILKKVIIDTVKNYQMNPLEVMASGCAIFFSACSAVKMPPHELEEYFYSCFEKYKSEFNIGDDVSCS